MAEPFLSEIRLLSFNYAPVGWASCDGQILQITQNQALYALIGNTYGGSPGTTFALPDLRGRVPIHFGSGMPIGRGDGKATQPLSAAEIPAHTHGMQGTSAAIDSPDATGNHLGSTSAMGAAIYKVTTANLVPLHPSAIANAGKSVPHDNMQPYLTIHFAIALAGMFPPRQ